MSPLSSLINRTRNGFARRLESIFFAESTRRQYDTLALASLAPLVEEYVPWTASAMRPGGIRLCINEILIHDRRNVIELGGGISTILLARILAAGGGKLVSVDHDLKWQQITQNKCGKAANVVSFVHAPLKPIQCEGAIYHWYDVEAIRSNLPQQKADMLIVDGPVSSPGHLSRYPALPMMRDLLADDAVVVLDDIGRKDEKRIIEKWAASSTSRAVSYELPGGVAMLQLGDRQRFVIR
jgi:hypothetical protein